MTPAMEALYKNDKSSHDRLKVLENVGAVVVKRAFNDLQALKSSISGHDKNLDMLDKNLQNFLAAINDKFLRKAMIIKTINWQ